MKEMSCAIRAAAVALCVKTLSELNVTSVSMQSATATNRQPNQ